MSNTIGIALSGMTAETRRVEASASNLANARTRGALAPMGNERAPYTPITTSQSDVRGAGGQGTGTQAVFRPMDKPFVAEYDPSSPDADSDGMVGAPNVDPEKEFTQQILASRAYKANASVIRTTDEMKITA
jgi:flagellar basal-body rod protein FlgC